jgi:transcriptional regulator with XRE-family HTH domain
MSFFASNLRFLRQEMNLSQEELSRKVGLNRGNIASYEKGAAEPSIKNLSRIGKFFNIELSDLIDEDLSGKSSLMNDLEKIDKVKAYKQEKVQEILIESLEDQRSKIVKFRNRSDEMARILDGFRQFHKFRMENQDKLSDDVKKMALDYEKLLDVLEEVLSTNKSIIKLLDS